MVNVLDNYFDISFVIYPYCPLINIKSEVDKKDKLVNWLKPTDQQNVNGILVIIQHTHDKVLLLLWRFLYSPTLNVNRLFDFRRLNKLLGIGKETTFRLSHRMVSFMHSCLTKSIWFNLFKKFISW